MNYADLISRQQAAINYLVFNELDSSLGDGPTLQRYIASLSKLRSQAETSATPWPEDLKRVHDAFIEARDDFNRYLEELLLGSVSATAEGGSHASRAHALLHAIRDFSPVYRRYFLDDEAVKLTTYGDKLERLSRLESATMRLV